MSKKRELLRKRLTKQDVLTLPNAISLFRLILIPFIVWAFMEGQIVLTFSLVALSGISDVVDGCIARRYGLVSDLGKFLDPLADKLTQFVLILCLALRYSFLYLFALFFFVREALMLIFGLLILNRTDSVHSSRWYGKAATVLLYAVMLVLILFPDIDPLAAGLLFILCLGMMAYALVRYLMMYVAYLRRAKTEK